MTTDFDELIKYQNLLRKQLKREQQRDRKIELLSIINQLTAGPNNMVQKESLMVEAEMRGFSENQIEQILKKLKEDKIITESSAGYIKKC